MCGSVARVCVLPAGVVVGPGMWALLDSNVSLGASMRKVCEIDDVFCFCLFVLVQ